MNFLSLSILRVSVASPWPCPRFSEKQNPRDGSLCSLAVDNEMHLLPNLLIASFLDCYLDQTINKLINKEIFKTEFIKQGVCPSSRMKQYSFSGSNVLVIWIKEHLFCPLEQIELNWMHPLLILAFSKSWIKQFAGAEWDFWDLTCKMSEGSVPELTSHTKPTCYCLNFPSSWL